MDVTDEEDVLTESPAEAMLSELLLQRELSRASFKEFLIDGAREYEDERARCLSKADGAAGR
ncbi:MAG: hypothetical protein ACR2JC_06485 [Chloroflexota bacterium]|nr:MAG: hypothetical protein DLM70_03185 [Chloroflexota bacterium]